MAVSQQLEAQLLLVRQIAALDSMTLRDLVRDLPAIYRLLGLGDMTYFIQARLIAHVTQGEFSQEGFPTSAFDQRMVERLREAFKRRHLALMRDFVLNFIGESGQILWDRMQAVASGELDPNLEVKRHARH